MLATAVVLTVNVAFVAPAGTVTKLGTVAADELLDRLTESPPEGAAPESVTAPVEVLEPTSVVGFKLSEVRFGGKIVRVAVIELEPSVPMIVTTVRDATANVLTVNVAELFPAPIETLAGTVALAELLVNLTVEPPVGVGPVSVTVPVEETVPLTVAGFSEREAIAGGLTVSVWLNVTDPWLAEIVADFRAVTGVVVTDNVALV